MIFSVIVTTYNRPDALTAVLEGLHAQRDLSLTMPDGSAATPSHRPASRRGETVNAFEVIVADDGSTDETRQAVEAFRPAFGCSLQHVWHADEGFRAGTIRNRAATRSRGERLIFLDGDCIPRPTFIAAHAAAASDGTMARGSRALLSQRFTERVLRDRLPVHEWSGGAWIKTRLRRDVNRLSGLLAHPWSRRAGAPSRDWRSVRTCNLAVWRRDFERVNGFDERFVGWGYEDSDLAIRLINAGVRVRRAGSAATVLHCWHRENDRRFEGENLRRLQQTERSGVIRAELGLAEAAACDTVPRERQP